MKKLLKRKKCFGIALILAMIAGLVPAETTMAAKKVSISKKNLTLTAGKSATLKLKNIKKSKKSKVKWSSSKKSVAVVNKSGKITAKKKGTAKITAKYATKTKPAITPIKKEDGYTKLTKYLMEKGTMDVSSGLTYYAMSSYYPNSDEMFGSIIYTPSDNCVTFSEIDGEFIFILIIDLKSPKVGIASMQYKNKESIGKVVVELMNGDGYDKVTWIQSSSLDDLGDATLRCGLLHWNMMLEENVGISLRDLGFTSYKLKS